jgi:hypothetical protein
MRAAGVVLGMKATARGTGKGSERGFERPVFWASLTNVGTLADGAVWKKKATVVARAALRSATAGVSVLLARWADLKRQKRVCPGVAANRTLETKELLVAAERTGRDRSVAKIRGSRRRAVSLGFGGASGTKGLERRRSRLLPVQTTGRV